MPHLRRAIRTLAILATGLAGTALLSGAMTAALAGGGYWAG
jgi:hypothetical protein